jgi:hypothetical protein
VPSVVGMCRTLNFANFHVPDLTTLSPITLHKSGFGRTLCYMLPKTPPDCALSCRHVQKPRWTVPPETSLPVPVATTSQLRSRPAIRIPFHIGDKCFSQLSRRHSLLPKTPTDCALGCRHVSGRKSMEAGGSKFQARLHI